MSGPDLFAPPPAQGEPGEETLYATVAPEVPVAGAFTYRVPPALRDGARVGVRVTVPFGGRRVRGYLLELSGSCPEGLDPRKVRPIAAVLDPEPVVTPEVLTLARWAADYYQSSLGEVLGAAVPTEVTAEEEEEAWVALTDRVPAGRLGARQRAVLAALAEGPLPLQELRRRVAAPADLLRRLEELGLLRREVRQVEADAAPESEPAAPPELTPEQRLALAPLLHQLERGEAGTTLLYGITGSGKTEVYLRAIARVLEGGRSAIVLVPEIALTPQTLERFRRRFGAGVAVLHSQLGGKERRREWRRVVRGEARVVVGPRSAVWAPARDLGLIVVDEEHETTYKQEHAPRYHARDLAVVRGLQAGVPVVLGSATPSLESWRNAQQGRFKIARLRTRPGGSALPRVVTVDMGAEWAEVQGAPLLSRVLVRELQEALARGERALLFQNRRGFTTFLQCPACGHVLKCRQCDVTLTYHRTERATLCHFCDARGPAPGGGCPACLGPPLRQRGAGTERIEEIVQQLCPGAAVGRLDTDVVRGGATAEEVLERFRCGALQVLVGTQMIAKGLDVPEVTLVGVISADTSLALPDFRAAERTFQLVAQVAGRAGRGTRPGCTVIQTFLPQHFAIRAAAEHSFEAFAAPELEARQALGYPPFSRLAKLLWRGPDAARVQAEAEGAVEELRALPAETGVVGILGPAPSPRAYLAGKHRFQALIKGSAPGIRAAIGALRQRRLAAGVEWILDVDAVHLL